MRETKLDVVLQDIPPKNEGVAQPKLRRFLRALFLTGHPKIKSWACWMFFLPQLVLYLYLLGPVFVYFTQGVPSKESLEVITGVWRQEGKIGANRNGLVAPKYFIDTDQGRKEVHCGFPMQRLPCDTWSGPTFWPDKRVTVFYDSYFGILAFEHLEAPGKHIVSANMSYEKGILYYAKPKDTIYRNYHAHWMLLIYLILYAVFVYIFWAAGSSKSSTQEKPCR